MNAPFIHADVVKAQINSLLSQHPELREDDEALVLSLESETDLTALITKLVMKIGETKALSSGLAAHISDLRGRLDDYDRRVEAMRDTVFQVMQVANVKTLPLSVATVAVRPGPQKVYVTDLEALPDECRRTPPPEPLKMIIKEMLKNGQSVPGAFLSNGEDVLSIRVR